MSRERRRYTMVTRTTRDAVVHAVIARINAGDSFTAAARAAAEQIDVAETTVRTWVNRSGLRPRPGAQVVTELKNLKSQLEMAQEINRRLVAQYGLDDDRTMVS